MLDLDIDGIGKITALEFRNRRLFLVIELAGLEDRPIEISCDKIVMENDGSEIMLSGLSSSMPFVENALRRFAPERIAIPEGRARQALAMAKKIMGL